MLGARRLRQRRPDRRRRRPHAGDGLKDPKERFTAAADDYDRGRPGYPAELIDWVLSTTHAKSAADVGCGTGISTRLFAEKGVDIVGVDPNESMLAKARAHGGKYVKGEAAATGLPDAVVELIVVAQAFHWFVFSPAFKEFRRILKPDGWCAAFWNDRAEDTSFLREYEALLLRSSVEYRSLKRMRSTLDDLKKASGLTDKVEGAFKNVQVMDWEAFRSRVNSSSYVVHGIEDRSAFDGALAALFKRHARSGKVEFAYKALGLCWRFKARPPEA